MYKEVKKTWFHKIKTVNVTIKITMIIKSKHIVITMYSDFFCTLHILSHLVPHNNPTYEVQIIMIILILCPGNQGLVVEKITQVHKTGK